ncbi:MAG: hypothetical protein KY467_08900 [Gemmatimonadetes bacterium]|nr:hypothetical protein [Gemmatimonadota bacterium]
MRKLRLDLDAVTVESFETSARARVPGTVVGLETHGGRTECHINTCQFNTCIGMECTYLGDTSREYPCESEGDCATVPDDQCSADCPME